MNKNFVTGLKKIVFEGVTTDKVEFKTEYEQGEEGGRIQFSLVCENLPIGTIVCFSSDKSGPTPPISILPTQVTYSPNFIVGIICLVPANYDCTITSYAIFKENPPKGSSMSLQASYIVE
jgi:hypothetical protein